MRTTEILIYKTRSGILTAVPVSLSGEDTGLQEPNYCPYCMAQLSNYNQKRRCYNNSCPSNGATPEELYQSLGKGWMHPFYTYFHTPELLIYTCYIHKAIAIPYRSKENPGYNIAMILPDIKTLADIAFFTGANQDFFSQPARKSDEEILAEIRNRPNYHYHE